jgi:hypothetical protein
MAQAIDDKINAAFPVYMWDENRIKLFIFSEVSQPKDIFTSVCRKLLSHIRKSELEWARQHGESSTFLSQAFIPPGGMGKSPKIQSEIDKIISVIYSDNTNTCSGSLLGSEILVTKK